MRKLFFEHRASLKELVPEREYVQDNNEIILIIKSVWIGVGDVKVGKGWA